MIARVERLFTPEEYLSIERTSDFESEFYCGKIYAMAGASPEHSVITMNVGDELYSQPSPTHSLRIRPAERIRAIHEYT